MRQLSAAREVPGPRERAFALLADLDVHWRLAGRWVEVLELDGPVGGRRGGRVVVRGPAGLRRTVATRIDAVEPPGAVLGTARAGARTSVEVAWRLDEVAGGAATRVTLRLDVRRAGPLDRLVLALGGRWWLRRQLAGALDRLAAELALVPAVRHVDARPV